MCALMDRLVLSLLCIDLQGLLDAHHRNIDETQSPIEEIGYESSVTVRMRQDCERYEACLNCAHVLVAQPNGLEAC